MVFELSKSGVMEFLWDTLEKTPDGKFIRYNQSDIEQLWWMGFVDAEHFGLDVWFKVFEPYKQPDGTYHLAKEEFLALDHYRYKGEVRIPFDAMMINEGKYTDEGLDDLIGASIAPSCSLTREELREFVENIRKEFRQNDGLILIRKSAKEKIKNLIYEHPSPLRNLELLLDNMIEQQTIALEQSETDAATTQAAIQASQFSQAPTTRVEAKAAAYKDLEKTKKTKEVEIKDKPKVELKKIKRSRKGMRG